MSDPTPLTNQQLDAIQARIDSASKGPWKLAYEYCDCSEDCGHGLYVSRIDTGSGPATELCDLPRGEWELMVHARADVEQLVAEVRRLRARVTELEEAGTYARSALAALCYDLEDPGSNAFGALHEISRATTGVPAPRDEAAAVLARHDADVIRKAAEVLEETDRDDDAVNLLYLLADQAQSTEETHVVTQEA